MNRDFVGCRHWNFEATVNVTRIAPQLAEGMAGEPDLAGEIEGYAVTVAVRCSHCGVALRFLGLEVGAMPDRPMVSVDGCELRAPAWPADDSEGQLRAPKGPGFRMVVTER